MIVTLALAAVLLVGCTPPRVSVEDLRAEAAASAPVDGAVLLGERTQQPAAGGLMGMPVTAQLEQVWATTLNVERLFAAYRRQLDATYELRASRGPGGVGLRLSGQSTDAALTITLLPDGPHVLAGETPPPLDTAPVGTAAYATVVLSGRG